MPFLKCGIFQAFQAVWSSAGLGFSYHQGSFGCIWPSLSPITGIVVPFIPHTRSMSISRSVFGYLYWGVPQCQEGWPYQWVHSFFFFVPLSHDLSVLACPTRLWCYLFQTLFGAQTIRPTKVMWLSYSHRLHSAWASYIQLNLKPRYSKFLSLGMPPSTLTILIFVRLEGDFFSQRNRCVPTISVCPRKIGVSDISYCMIEQATLHWTLFLPLDFPETVLTKKQS